MILKYFDIHSHLNFADFDDDREEVIGRMQENDIWTICVGSDFESSKKAVEIAERHDEGVYASVGLHPIEVASQPLGGETAKLKELAKHPKVVAIGECGLDVFRRKKDDLPRQKDIFKQQIELAIELDKPLMIHCRDAHGDVLEILNSYKCPKLRGDIHFFSGSLEQAEKYFELGFLISFTGVITFARDYDEIIRNAPLDKIMIETDAPFVAPVPYRGKRNEPAYVIEVAKKIAEIRSISEEEAAEAATSNALKLFRI
jgi:TatD DNase family protein